MFTFIVNFRNAGDWIERCLDSIQRQTVTDWVALITDDASTDVSSSIAAGFVRSDSRMVLTRNRYRRNAFANTLTSLERCHRDTIVVVVDGDDWLASEEVLAKLVDVYRDPDVESTHWGFALHDYKGGAFDGYTEWAPTDPRSTAQWVEAHLRSFRYEVFLRIPSAYFFAATGQVPAKPVDSVLHWAICGLSRKTYRFDEVVYFWNLSANIGHDWNYENPKSIETDPVKAFYRDHVHEMVATVRGGGSYLDVREVARVDRLEDLFLVRGAPLVCQSAALLIVLDSPESVERQLREFLKSPCASGLIVVDNASSGGEGGLSRIVSLLEGCSFPHVLVANREQKSHAQNLYNALHLLSLPADAEILDLSDPGVQRRFDKSLLVQTPIRRFLREDGLGWDNRSEWIGCVRDLYHY
jgi:glycosyltransferase involved in cell wall biosynthesis